jgi:hypothetical protein
MGNGTPGRIVNEYNLLLGEREELKNVGRLLPETRSTVPACGSPPLPSR